MTQDEGSLLEILGRREEFLRALADDELSKPSLVERLDVSRSTVDRGVRELRQGGCITRTDDGYTLSVTGRALLRSYDQFVATATDVVTAEPLLGHLPPEAEVAPVMLRDSDVVSPRQQQLYQPAERIESLLHSADRVRGFAKAHTQPKAVETFYREIVERGTKADFVLQRSMYERLDEMGDERLQEVLASRQFTVQTVPKVPYSLFVFASGGARETACLVVYDDETVLRGCLVNDTEAALDWADRRIRDVENRATPPE